MMEYREEELILGGRMKLVTELNEFRMGIWINGFGIFDPATGQAVLPLMLTFDLGRLKEEGDLLEIDFRIYPDGSKYYSVTVDPFDKTFVYENQTYSTNDFGKLFDQIGDLRDEG